MVDQLMVPSDLYRKLCASFLKPLAILTEMDTFGLGTANTTTIRSGPSGVERLIDRADTFTRIGYGWGSRTSNFQLHLQPTSGNLRCQRRKPVCKSVVHRAEFQVAIPS